MDLREYQNLVLRICFGKRLPTAVYVHLDRRTSLGEKLDQLVGHVVSSYRIGPEFNFLKFRTDDLKVSFLSYPRFFEDPHPVLCKAVTIDLRSGKARHTDYAANLNPPILHRKESFLPPDHPRRDEFEKLTREEEQAGLYEKVETIGFKLNWERLLAKKGVVIEGHTLRKTEPNSAKGIPSLGPIEVHRHKTAMTRYDLSKPVKSLLEYGLLRSGSSFFDYGCGQGTDVNGLRALGYAAEGWDPVYRPDAPKSEADIVNVGYVLNVIENPAERLEVLVDAYRHARRLLVVAGLISETVERSTATLLGDGVLTKRKTFQKYFEQAELQQYIEDALEMSAVPVALGVFYVFRDPTEQQDFLAARMRRRIDWTEVSTRLGLGEPKVRKPRWELLYGTHRELLDEFWSTTLQLGRLPAPTEFPRFGELQHNLGSAKRAMRMFLAQGGEKELEAARERRRNELLVYLGQANLRRRVPFGLLSPSLRLDIRTFWGDYGKALKAGLELLYAAGDPRKITSACADLKAGWQDEQALYVHQSLLEKLPPVLRAYVGCATTLFGDVDQADLIKIHKASGKVTFLSYDDFEGKPLPELQLRVKVNLRTRWVETFNHSQSGQCLYFKERFVSPEHPRLDEMRAFSARLGKLGITDQLAAGPTRTEFLALCNKLGLNENLTRKRISRSTH